jgi:hypothetical protein
VVSVSENLQGFWSNRRGGFDQQRGENTELTSNTQEKFLLLNSLFKTLFDSSV